MKKVLLNRFHVSLFWILSVTFSEPTIDTITVMISTFSGLYYNRTNENFIEFIREV